MEQEPGQYLPSPPYSVDPRPPSQDGRNSYFPDSTVPPDYRGLNGQGTPHSGPQNGPNSYQPPSLSVLLVNSLGLILLLRSPNITPQQHPSPQMAAQPHPQERRFSTPQFISPTTPFYFASAKSSIDDWNFSKEIV